jgi:hypothetical protein
MHIHFLGGDPERNRPIVIGVYGRIILNKGDDVVLIRFIRL